MVRVNKYNIKGRYKDHKFSYAFTFKKGGQLLDPASMEFYIELRRSGKDPIFFKMGQGLSIEREELLWEFGDELQIEAGTYNYAMKIVMENHPYTILKGKFSIEPEIVKRNN